MRLTLLGVGIAATLAAAAPDSLYVLYTASANGNLRHCECPEGPYGGLPRRASLIAHERRAHSRLLIVDTGDLGSPFPAAFKDSLFYAAFARLPYDAVGVGDQEFVNGLDFFRRTIAGSRIPFVSANLVWADGRPVFPAYRIRRLGGLRVGLTAVLDPAALKLYPRALVSQFTVRAPDEALGDVIAELTPQVDLIILLSHLGFDAEQRVARAFPRIGMIVNGHSMTRLEGVERVDGTVLVGSGADAKWVGLAALDVAGDTVRGARAELIALSDRWPDDPALAAATAPYFGSVAARTDSTGAPGGAVRLTLFYARDCEHCLAIMHEFLPGLERRYPGVLATRFLSVDDPAVYRQLLDWEHAAGGGERELPVLFIGRQVLGGENAIRQQLEPLVIAARARGGVDWSDFQAPAPAAGRGPIEVVFFAQPSCAKCARTERDLAALRTEFPDLVVRTYSLTMPANKELAEAFGRAYGVPGARRLLAPSIFTGSGYLITTDVTYDNLRRLLLQPGPPVPWDKVRAETATARSSIFARFRTLTWPGVIIAGLLDGINPCAFTTLVFFTSYLAFVGLAGGRILLVGLFFILGDFIVYFVIGLFGYRALRLLETLQHFRIVVQVILGLTAVAALVFAILSVLDYFKARQGRFSEMSLQLPRFLKERVHASIRQSSALGGYLVGAFLLGCLVNLYELVCTGQIYLAVIVFVASMPGMRGLAVPYLLVYNVAFLVPLVVVFVLAYLGITSPQIQKFYSRQVGLVKVATAVFFLALATALVYLIFLRS